MLTRFPEFSIRQRGLALLAALVVMMGVGCRSTPTANDVTAEGRSGYGLLASRLRVQRTADGLFVSGSVQRGAFYSGSPRMHLDVAVSSGDGRQLALVPASFFPNPIPRSTRFPCNADYAQNVRGDFPPGVRVVVEFHPVSLRECGRRRAHCDEPSRQTILRLHA